MSVNKVSRLVKFRRVLIGVAIGPFVIFLPFFFTKEAPDNPPITLTQDACSAADILAGRCDP